MSIHFISGKPGGGKSMYAVKLLVAELRTTKRDVVTNLPLKLPDLAEYLEREFGSTFDMHERLELLTESDIGEFWLHRGRGRRLVERVERELRGRKLNVVDYAPAADWGGVFYAIDEIHIAFNARKWQETGEDCIYYLSQHRKLGDDVICITQHVNNVDKQFRTMAQDYTYLRNMSKEKVGIFRSFPLFQRSTYLQPATGGPQERAQETAMMRIDVKGLGQVYDTAAGVGIHGRLADTQAPRKGFSLVWLFAALALGGVVLGCMPGLVGKAARSVMRVAPSGKSVATNVVRAATVATNVTTGAAGATAGKDTRPGVPSPPVVVVVNTNPPVEVTGVFPSFPDPGLTVALSNGEKWRTVDGHISYLGKRHVIIGTNRYEWRKVLN